MKKFLAIYLGTMSGSSMEKWNALDKAARQEREQTGIAAWGRWAQKNQNSIIEIGSPLGKTKRTDLQGVTDTKNLMTGYTLVQAESHEAAAKLFADHPHFTIFPGESIEIMECLAIPGM